MSRFNIKKHKRIDLPEYQDGSADAASSAAASVGPERRRSSGDPQQQQQQTPTPPLGGTPRHRGSGVSSAVSHDDVRAGKGLSIAPPQVCKGL